MCRSCRWVCLCNFCYNIYPLWSTYPGLIIRSYPLSCTRLKYWTLRLQDRASTHFANRECIPFANRYTPPQEVDVPLNNIPDVVSIDVRRWFLRVSGPCRNMYDRGGNFIRCISGSEMDTPQHYWSPAVRSVYQLADVSQFVPCRRFKYGMINFVSNIPASSFRVFLYYWHCYFGLGLSTFYGPFAENGIAISV